MVAVVQQGGTEFGAQRVPVEGHGEVRGFPTGGRTHLGGGGEPPHLQQRVGVALVAAARVGDVLGQGAGLGELVDQPLELGAVFAIEAPLEPEFPVAAVPQPQFTSGRCRAVVCGVRGRRGRGGPVGAGRVWPVRWG